VAKRIVLFLLLNAVVILTISVLLRVLGIQPYLTERGIDYGSLMAFCLVWGMGGAFISLALSRVMAKAAMRVQVIDPQSREPMAQELLQTVERLARSAGLPMPQVGIYQSDDINAFATGPTRSRALVAVSTGLLRKLGRDEVEGVLGHEMTHVANGDMVTMTLLQGVVNAFVMFLARALAFAAAQSMRRDDSENVSFGIYFAVQIVLEIVFMILGSIVVASFSRWREFRADAGGAHLAGRDRMVRALTALKRDVENVTPQTASPAFAAFRISNRGGGWLGLFASHPPLDERIARLERMTA
jgi:heat shock protein HtpX